MLRHVEAQVPFVGQNFSANVAPVDDVQVFGVHVRSQRSLLGVTFGTVIALERFVPRVFLKSVVKTGNKIVAYV